MRRIAVINQKGGVGKTTTTVSLGAALAGAGARVLLLDLDPQAHLSLHFGIDIAEDQPSIYDVFLSGVSISEAAVHPLPNLAVVPADIDLAGAEAELISITGREVLLREAVDSGALDFDYLLIDCPPSLGVLTVNALVACREVLIPLQAQFFALQGLSKLLDTVTLVRQRINPALIVSGIVLCMHEAATRLANEVVEDLSQFLESSRGSRAAWANARIFDTRVRRNIKLAEAPSFGRTVFDYAPRSNGAIDYANLAVEIFGVGPVVSAVGVALGAFSNRPLAPGPSQNREVAGGLTTAAVLEPGDAGIEVAITADLQNDAETLPPIHPDTEEGSNGFPPSVPPLGIMELRTVEGSDRVPVSS